MNWKCIILLAATLVFSARVNRVGFESEHFQLFINESRQKQAPEILGYLENSYRKLGEFFNYQLNKKVEVIILDEDDISNGMALSAQNWLSIYLPVASIPLRDPSLWLENVISHELAHVMSLRKTGETKKYLGNTVNINNQTSLSPVYSVQGFLPYYNRPPWLAEGLAQYASYILGLDTLGTRRKMFLETAYQQQNFLSLEEMRAFSWDSRKNEQIYAQGFLFVDYLYSSFGADSINIWLASISKSGWKKSFREIFNKTIEQVYQDFKTLFGKNIHFTKTDNVKGPIPLPLNIPYVYEPYIAPVDKENYFFTSSRENDFGRTDLYLSRSGKIKKIKNRVDGPIRYWDKSKELYFIAHKLNPKNRTFIRDVFSYNLESGQTKRLSQNIRAKYLDVCVDGTIVVLSEMGGKPLFYKSQEENWVSLNFPGNMGDIQSFACANAANIVLEVVKKRGSDLYNWNYSNNTVVVLKSSSYNEINPLVRKDSLFYQADYTGQYKSYLEIGDSLFVLEENKENVFNTVLADGKLWYSHYQQHGFVLQSSGFVSKPFSYVPPDLFPEPQKFPETDYKLTSRQDGLRYLGWYSSFDYEMYRFHPKDFQAADEEPLLGDQVLATNHHVYKMGGGLVFSHPAFESLLEIQGATGPSFIPEYNKNNWAYNLSAIYETSEFAPIFTGGLIVDKRELLLENSDRTLDFTQYLGFIMGQYLLSQYISLFAQGAYSGLTISQSQWYEKTSGGSSMFMAAIQGGNSQPGVNFTNSQINFLSGLYYIPLGFTQDAWVWLNSFQYGSHIARRFFGDISFTTNSYVSESWSSDYNVNLSLKLDILTQVNFPGFLLCHIFPMLDFDLLGTFDAEHERNEGYGYRGARPKAFSIAGNQKHFFAISNATTLFSTVNTGISFKFLSFLNNPALLYVTKVWDPFDNGSEGWGFGVRF